MRDERTQALRRQVGTRTTRHFPRGNLVSFDIVGAGGRAAEVERCHSDLYGYANRLESGHPSSYGRLLYCLNGSGFDYPATVTVAARFDELALRAMRFRKCASC